MLSFLQVDKGTLSFIKLSFEKFKIHEIFITADRSAWPVLKRHQAAKFLKNFQVHFVLYSQENEVLVILEFPAPKKLTTINAVRDKQTILSPFIELTN